ncbi:MAG: GNAT family N-acetyltransferase [Planctomycetales bacterium]|nr:GNAT family N-acetyltransferase [Planctomycetales bacterium]
MTTPITIRNARPDDLPLIVDFNLRLADESEGKKLDRGVLTRGVARALGAPEMCRYFMAEVNGEIAGQTMITLELTDWRDGVLWWLQSVYVRPEFRKIGVFKALFRHIAALAKSTPDVRGLRLYVEQGNSRAQRVYEQMGMQPGGYLVYEQDWSLKK